MLTLPICLRYVLYFMIHIMFYGALGVSVS